MIASPLIVYKLLLKYFGPRGWWPVTKNNKLHPEYIKGKYEAASDKERFEICAGAILTQNTAWSNVEKAIYNLNLAGCLDCGKISRLKESELAGLIRPSGYFNQKAKRLKYFAKYMQSKYNRSLEKLFLSDLAQVRAELLSLNGIGPETADSMLLYAGGKKIFVVDAYTCRFASRIGWIGRAEYNEVQKYFQKNLPVSAKIYNEYHALIVSLGKDYCRKKPLCPECPLVKVCRKKGVKLD